MTNTARASSSLMHHNDPKIEKVTDEEFIKLDSCTRLQIEILSALLPHVG